MSEEKPQKRKRKRKKGDKEARLINFLLTPKQEEMLDYNIKKLGLADNKTQYFVNKITEDFQTQGKGYKKETLNDSTTKKDLDELEEKLFLRLDKRIQDIQMMAQSIANRKDSLDKEQKLAEIKQNLFLYNGLSKLDTYEKLEGYLVQQFPDWESDLVDEKIYYDLVYELLKEEGIKYNKYSKKLIWSVPDK